MVDCDGSQVSLEEAIFRCRKCRLHLFSTNHLEVHLVDQLKSSSASLASYTKCSSWFLKDEDMLPWVKESVEEAQWTEGKLYCSKCKCRIGAFDFIHGIQCNCGQFIIPAVWIQKSRVDHVLPGSQIKNLDIRKPANPVQEIDCHPSQKAGCSLIISENQLKPAGCDRTRDEMSSGQELVGNHSGERNSSDTPFSLSHSTREFSLHTFNLCAPARNDTQLEKQHNTNLSHKSEACRVSDCGQCRCDVKHLLEAPVHIKEEHPTVNPNLKSCRLENGIRTEDFEVVESSSCLRGTVLSSDQGIQALSRSKRRRKMKSCERLDTPAYEWDVEERRSLQVGDADDHSNSFSCLAVDERCKEETFGNRNTKVAFPDFQDGHYCPICLDLLFEPFKCTCDHVFCDPCLRQLNFRTAGRALRCPLCRQIVEHVTPATDLRNEIKNSYDFRTLRKREKAERRAPYRKWPLPTSRGPLQRNVSRIQRRVTLPCVVFTFLACACVYSVAMTVLLSYLINKE